MNIHPQSRTTPQIRAEINDSDLSQRNLADKYNISRSTVCKWKKRKEMIDLSHRPHNLQTQLTQSQEAVVVELRRSLLLPLDDLVVINRVGGSSRSRPLTPPSIRIRTWRFD